MAYGTKLRVIAVYVPHAGYPVEDFEETFDQLRYSIQTGRNLKRRIIVGGDFNSQLNVGMRGAALDNLVNSFGLQISNDSLDDWDNNWTFRSCLGITRRIDFIMASKSLKVCQSYATNEIDLGSDHRAVKACFEIGCAKYQKKKPTTKMKGWKLVLDSDGSASQFQPELSQQLVMLGTTGPEVVEQALYNAATAPYVSEISCDRIKRWDPYEMQN